jgi:AraC-like DNA-binding protein
MSYLERATVRPLRPFVECLWAHGPQPAGAGSRRVLPDGCIDILFRRDTGTARAAEHSGLVLVGPMTHSEVFCLPAGRVTVGVRFRPGGAAALLGLHARALQDLSVPLADVVALDGARLLDGLCDASQTGERWRLLEVALLQWLPRAESPEPALQALTDAIGAQPPCRLESLAVRHGLGARQLRRAFDRWVGLRPKLFARIWRLRRVLEDLAEAPAEGWAERALEAGFYDQAHMNRDFRELIGVSPERFRAEA